MTLLFDGLSNLTAQTFGGAVEVTPPDSSATMVNGIFRAEPVSVLDEDGVDTLIVAPTLAVPGDQAALIITDTLVAPGDGKTYVVKNRVSEGSPAFDGMVLFELFEDAM